MAVTRLIAARACQPAGRWVGSPAVGPPRRGGAHGREQGRGTTLLPAHQTAIPRSILRGSGDRRLRPRGNAEPERGLGGTDRYARSAAQDRPALAVHEGVRGAWQL